MLLLLSRCLHIQRQLHVTLNMAASTLRTKADCVKRTKGLDTKLKEESKTTSHLKDKAGKALPYLHENEVAKQDSSKLSKSIEALIGGDEVEKKEIQVKDKDCIKDDRETHSRTSNQDDVNKRSDNKPQKTYLGQKEKERPPSLLEEKRFMIYICGGYKDTVVERSALMENVYPRLYLYCKQRGYDFRMVDLRWGIENPTAEQHDTIKLHVENLQQCQKTLGPNFILFVGEKYEVHSLPSTITTEAFEAIVKVLERKQQQISKNKSVEEFSASDSQSSIATDSSSASFVHKSIFGNYRNFGEQATNSGLLSQSSHSSFLIVEEARFSLMSEKNQANLDKDLTLLQMWYKLNKNFVPPVYCLLPISTHYPDMLSVEKDHRKQATKDWTATCQRLWLVLQHSAVEALGQEEASLLLRTVLDWEIETGLQSVREASPEEHCHCYKRVIQDLYSNLKNQHSAQYVDLLKGQAQLDPMLSTAHQRFMDHLHKKLRHTNIYERNVGWGQKGLNPKHSPSHQFYTERISSHFQRTVINSLKSLMNISKTSGPFDVVRREDVRVQIQEEIQRHINYGLHLGKGCTLRQAFLADVKRAMEQSKARPVLLLGPPGWGKSTTLAAVAQLVPSWMSGQNCGGCFTLHWLDWREQKYPSGPAESVRSAG